MLTLTCILRYALKNKITEILFLAWKRIANTPIIEQGDKPEFCPYTESQIWFNLYYATYENKTDINLYARVQRDGVFDVSINDPGTDR